MASTKKEGMFGISMAEARGPLTITPLPETLAAEKLVLPHDVEPPTLTAHANALLTVFLAQ
jgi:hypothetical protein